MAMMRDHFLFRRDAALLLPGHSSEATSLRAVWLIVLLFLVPLAGAAVTLPLVYAAGEAWPSMAGQDAGGRLFGSSVARNFSNLRWLWLLVLLPLVVRATRIPSLAAIGLDSEPRNLRHWSCGLGAGLLLVATLAAIHVIFVPGRPLPAPPSWIVEIGRVVATAALGSVVEEALFRGLVLRAIYTSTRRPWLALLLTSVVFSYVHHKAPVHLLGDPGAPTALATGARLAWWTLIGIGLDFEALYFVGLTLLGMVLGALVMHTGSLWPAIGLHAGLVAGMLIFQRRWVVEPGPGLDFWGSTQLINGLVPNLALAGILVALIVAGRRRSR